MLHHTKKKPRYWTERQKAEWQKEIGRRLREAIEAEYGYRQEYVFAKAIGISQGSLSDIISGKSTPSAYTLVKMSSLGIPGLDAGFILGGF